jgi:protein required for attachment to host cells
MVYRLSMRVALLSASKETEMKLPANAHVAVVDGRRFVLMRTCGTAVDPLLESEGQPEVDETNYSAGTRHQDDGRNATIEPLEKYAHAAGAAEWLNRAVLSRRIEQLLVIADPDTLGEMRHHYHKETQQALVGELGRLLTGVPGPAILKAIRSA